MCPRRPAFRSIGRGAQGLAPKTKVAINYGGLCRGDKALGAPAFPAFVDMMRETRLFLLCARKAHLPAASDAARVLGKRLWRSDPLCHATLCL